MISFIRRFKLPYIIYNMFHKKQLEHNLPVYKKLGLKKKYFSPVSSLDFRHLGNENNGIAECDAVKATALYRNADPESKKSLDEYNETGFAILKNYLSAEQALVINKEIDKLVQDKTISFRYGNKLMFAIHYSQLIDATGNDPALTELLSVLLNGKAKLFQSINFISGSEQDTHSDSIHMTTYPLGGLLGVWIALEDITEENGPLHYYPGSHKLPYYLNSDYDNAGNRFMIGKKGYYEYEKMIEGKIKEAGIKKEIFTAQSGDLLIWHANLLHGGEEHANKSKTRKSMVFHYFREGAVCYHEISQRPALIKPLRN